MKSKDFDSREYLNFSLTTDLLIFSISNEINKNIRELSKKNFSILLVKREKDPYDGKWVLPGGFVEKEETLDQSAKRVLKKETNLEDIYKEQLYTFSDLNRDPRMRVISTAYLSLIDKNLLIDNLNEYALWFDIKFHEKGDQIIIELVSNNEINKIVIDKLNDNIIESTLGFDHAKMIVMGINTLREKILKTDIAFNLMTKEFTLGDLQQVYELILNKKLFRAPFRKMISNKVVSTGKIVKNGGHRPSELYKYKNKGEF